MANDYNSKCFTKAWLRNKVHIICIRSIETAGDGALAEFDKLRKNKQRHAIIYNHYYTDRNLKIALKLLATRREKNAFKDKGTTGSGPFESWTVIA